MAGKILGQVYDNHVLVVALTPEKNNEANRKRHFERRRQGLSSLERTIRQGIETALFRDLPAGLVSEIFSGAIAGLVEQMVLSGEFRKPEELVPTLMKIFLDGLRSHKD